MARFRDFGEVARHRGTADRFVRGRVAGLEMCAFRYTWKDTEFGDNPAFKRLAIHEQDRARELHRLSGREREDFVDRYGDLPSPKASVPVTRECSLMAVQLPHPVPELRVHRRRSKVRGRRLPDLRVMTPWFADDWEVETEDPGFAALALPERHFRAVATLNPLAVIWRGDQLVVLTGQHTERTLEDRVEFVERILTR